MASMSIRRRATGWFTLTAALMVFAGRAPAQFTWNNPAGGNWSVNGNWLGGAAPTAGSVTTTLTFGSPATISATYTATNNVGGVPFDLNAFTFNGNAGTMVTIAGTDNTGNGLIFA